MVKVRCFWHISISPGLERVPASTHENELVLAAIGHIYIYLYLYIYIYMEMRPVAGRVSVSGLVRRLEPVFPCWSGRVAKNCCLAVRC